MTRVAEGLTTLRCRADFVAASREGVKIGGAVVALQMRDRAEPQDKPRIGFTVTKRVGGSVERSRMKRRLRAAARAAIEGSALPGCDYVLIARRAVLDVGFERLKRDMAEAVRRAHGRRGHKPGPAQSRPEGGR